MKRPHCICGESTFSLSVCQLHMCRLGWISHFGFLTYVVFVGYGYKVESFLGVVGGESVRLGMDVGAEKGLSCQPVHDGGTACIHWTCTPKQTNEVHRYHSLSATPFMLAFALSFSPPFQPASEHTHTERVREKKKKKKKSEQSAQTRLCAQPRSTIHPSHRPIPFFFIFFCFCCCLLSWTQNGNSSPSSV